MSNQRLTRRAVHRSEFALALLDDAEADNVIDLSERRMLRAAMVDTDTVIHAADKANALSEAVQRAVGETDERYLLKLFEEWRAARDELPLDAA